MKLLIKPEDDFTKAIYANHQHYNPGDSGIDLFSPETITVKPGETVKINLQIKCEALNDSMDSYVSYYLYPRSSISKTPLRMANSVGIIDSGYRGNLMVAVDNISDESYTIEAGQRLFQICSPTLDSISFDIVNQLTETSRGSGGFGSTNQ